MLKFFYNQKYKKLQFMNEQKKYSCVRESSSGGKHHIIQSRWARKSIKEITFMHLYITQGMCIF